VYTGSAQGYGGTITVQVTVEGGKITAIEILDASGETASFLSRAMAVIDSVLASQTWEVDVVSGATYSSNGILGAIQNALTGEAVETETAAEQVTAVTTLSSDSFTDAAAYADGVYTGSAQGFGGQITVQVTISGGVMTAIKIVSAPGETSSYLARAKSVISDMLKSGSPNVDVVSGATYSSTGIINAVKRALNKAAINGTETEEVTETEESTETTSTKKTTVRTTSDTSQSSGTYADGVYTGTGTGFGGDITVQVTVKKGKITKIKILSAEDETPSYLKKAKGIISSILAAQSTEVDVVSGATYSSEGILEAVQNALKQALSDDSGESSEENSGKEETDSGSEKTNTQEDSEETQSEETGDGEDATGYADGVYSIQVQCTDDDIFSYWLQVDVTIGDGQITGIEVTKYDGTSDDPDSNETYLNYAINGRTYRSVWYEGVVSQVLTLQSGDGVDVVSRATYSSNAIITGVQVALEQALAAYSSDQTEENESESSEEGSSAQEQEETQEGEDESESSEDDSAGQDEGDSEDGGSSEDDSSEQQEEESQEQEGDGDSSEDSGSEDEGTGYTDGTYSAQTQCTDEELFSYWLQIDLTIQSGLITGVDVTKYNDTSDDPESNETYLNYAINGRTYKNVWYEGVVSQVPTLQSGDGVDVVSRATYSSNAIIAGVQYALSQASAGSGE
ncbi:MAG: FMN-binding protein, partial [Lachnospiraceae bacterium]|nr:FMN-binding protein [Lachnospiraceae bacterium]